MVQPVQDNQTARSSYSRRNGEHPWLWLGLMGGSVAVHAVLIVSAFPFFDRLLSPPIETGSIPVEWVELPPIEQSLAQEPPPPVPETSQPEPATPATEPPPQKVVGDITGQTGVQPLPQAEQTPIGYQPEVQAEEEISVPPVQPPQPEVPPSPEPLPPEQTTETPGGNQEVPESPQSSTLQPPQAAASDTTNPFPTIPIDQAPPDLSERLEIPTEPIDPATLSQTDINPEAPTAVFLAILTVVPVAAAGEPAPTPSEITSRNISDPATSPCISFINPEILRSLEITLTADVLLLPTGEVNQVELRDLTDNPAYNELAECVVRSWNFNIASPPTPNDPTISDPNS
ncbi:hypothetical protein C7B76_25045, partial [filamentous cyanobacterium CCP2]